jgi:hypothetical protein
MARRSRSLGSPESDHIASAKKLVDDAWLDLERMPPTCEGGITLASRAFANAQRAQAHLQSVDDRALRKKHTKLYGLANRASNAAWETITFFKTTCKAPYPKAGERPLFSRGRLRGRRR